MIPKGYAQRALSTTVNGRPLSTWVHPNAREIVAQTFSDVDLPPIDTQDITIGRRRVNLDDLANTARYNDSLIASRRRRRRR